jgi:hypothetical protein
MERGWEGCWRRRPLLPAAWAPHIQICGPTSGRSFLNRSVARNGVSLRSRLSITAGSATTCCDARCFSAAFSLSRRLASSCMRAQAPHQSEELCALRLIELPLRTLAFACAAADDEDAWGLGACPLALRGTIACGRVGDSRKIALPFGRPESHLADGPGGASCMGGGGGGGEGAAIPLMLTERAEEFRAKLFTPSALVTL